MSRINQWTEIRELSPAPEGVPLQVRCLFNRAALVLPLMASAGRWRHINRSPEERGAWLGAEFRPTHWQHFADPDMPDPIYRVVARCFQFGGHVITVGVPGGEGLSFGSAMGLVDDARAHDRVFGVQYPHLPPIYREYLIERDDDDPRDLSFALADHVSRLESVPDALERMAAEDAEALESFDDLESLLADSLDRLAANDEAESLAAAWHRAFGDAVPLAAPGDPTPEADAFYYPMGIAS
jgi:hypothetical protein